ncbi:MAG: gfo/Idh/MocA family oxidoreductase [Planctomycetia bacterium]|nr:gfo/Idh/MocA family oxidoreductase [Planctomycetia bacterium]
MIRLGVIDFDTSHVVEFTRRLNRVGIADDQGVDGARVVVACPGSSALAPERIPGYKAEMVAMGVPLVERPEDMIGQIDGVLICSLEGAAHLQRARPFLEAGLPCFIDKPFTCSVADACELVALSQRYSAPIFSSSAMRYAPEVVAYVAQRPDGDILGAVSYGPAQLAVAHARDGVRGVSTPRWRNPGWFHYGIHPAELLYTLMGPGCRQLTCSHEIGADVVTAHWHNGRVATVRGLRSGDNLNYGFLVFAERATRHVPVSTGYAYRELLKQIVTFFQTKIAPVPPSETVELMAFLEAALSSQTNGGTPAVV